MSDKIIQLNEDLIKHDLKDLVRNSVEETLNALLDKEADELVNAEKYERSSDRQGYRSGHYKRNLHTTAGEVELKVPKLKGILQTATFCGQQGRIFRTVRAILNGQPGISAGQRVVRPTDQY